MKYKLPPIDHSEDVEKYEAKSSQVTIDLRKCKHKRASMQNNELRCPCGASWTGPRINELLQILTQ